MTSYRNHKCPVIAILGSENQGKSTLFNILTRSRDALISSAPGFTRDRRYGEFVMNNQLYKIIDTGGITRPGDQFYSLEVNYQAEQGIEEATLLYVVISAEHDARDVDIDILEKCRKTGKPVIVIASKCDKVSSASLLERNYQYLGLPVCPVSSTQNRGISSLLELTMDMMPQGKWEEEPDTEEEPLVCCIVGKPNAGKSTLINQIVKEKRVVTAAHPGTTTDNVEVPFMHQGKRWLLVDTAGVRRKAKSTGDIETLSAIRTLDYLYKVKVVLMILDGSEKKLTHQDLYLLNHCFVVRKKPVITVVNKSDLLTGGDKQEILSQLKSRFPKLSSGDVYFTCALSGKGVNSLLSRVRENYESGLAVVRSNALTTHLNKVLSKKNFSFKIKYVHLGGRNPLTLVFHGSRMQDIKSPEKAFLENVSRSFLKLKNTPMKIIIKQREKIS